MPYKDLHESPFPDSTITKLEIFEDYAEAWLPTFVMQQAFPEIHIFDFFAGPGYDLNDVLGSPIRLLQMVRKFEEHISNTKTKVVFHFNEFEPKKIKQEKYEYLVKNVEEYLNAHSKMKEYTSITTYNKDAKDLFFELLPMMQAYPSLVYLDQNGIRFISQSFIEELEKLKTVDFLYFVSSSYFWRLGHTEEFKKVLELDMVELRKQRYVDIHRIVCNNVKAKLPANSSLSLYPFSIRKDQNIFGIIFGAKHPRAVDKFLDIAWKRNEIYGEADFDIDGDALPEKYVQGDLFAPPVVKKVTKVDAFKSEFKKLVLSGVITDNITGLKHVYTSGHLPKHAADVLREMKRNKEVDYQGATPGLNYVNVFKDKNTIKFKVNGTV